MSTRAYDYTRALAVAWERIYPSAVCAGIVADAPHRRLRQGTFHLSREDNPPHTFSVVRPDDQGGPDDASAGIDMAMNKVDMVLCTRRLEAVWADLNDPRRKYVNAFNGWLGVGGAVRFDVVSRKRGRATPVHKGHVHLELRRRYVLSRAAMIAILSVLRGEGKHAYLRSIGVSADPVPAAKPGGRVGKPAVPKYPGAQMGPSTEPDPGVRTFQVRMLQRGWKSLGEPDGILGPKTESVVVRFQRVCKVKADGLIGPVTWPLPWTRPL